MALRLALGLLLTCAVEGSSVAFGIGCGRAPVSTFISAFQVQALCGYSVAGSSAKQGAPQYALSCVDNLAGNATVLAVDSTSLTFFPSIGVQLHFQNSGTSGQVYSNVTCSCQVTGSGLNPSSPTALVYLGSLGC